MTDQSEFYIAIQGVLKSWTALQLAVSNGFGGPHSAEKAQWLVGATVNYFEENDDLEEYEIEEFLAQIMSEEFETVLEDDSLPAIAKEICLLYELWSEKKFDKLQARIANMPQVNLGECLFQGDEDEAMVTSNEEGTMSSLSLSENAGTSSSNPENGNHSGALKDEDGWTTVVTRSRAKKKS